MAGFPSRVSRAIFGPKRVDTMPAPNDVNFVRDFFFNLIFWVVPGLVQTAAKAGAFIKSADGTLYSHEEAWHPDGGPAPTPSKVGTGHYRLVYANTYKDEEDNDVAPALTRARGFVQSSSARHCTCTVTNGVQVDVYVWDAAGAAADADVWVEAF